MKATATSQLFGLVQRNLVSIISLVVAISALSYNTYRNELTEINRNIRYAGFEILRELNQLQLLIDYAHYDNDTSKGNPITGWSHVMYIKDMSHLISPEMVESANQFGSLWTNEWRTVNGSRPSNQRMTRGINTMRGQLLDTMNSLE